jgi:predicted transcriptional regulator
MDYLPGEWSADEYGPDVEVPLRGVTAGVVRAVPFESLSAVPDVIEWIRRERPRDLERLAGSALTKEDVQRRRPGPKGPSDEYLVEYAEEYHALVAQGKPNPHTILARTCDLSHERSKHLMSMARDRGLAISPSTEDGRGGRAGGSLTPKGEAILQQMKKNRRRKTQ